MEEERGWYVGQTDRPPSSVAETIRSFCVSVGQLLPGFQMHAWRSALRSFLVSSESGMWSLSTLSITVILVGFIRKHKDPTNGSWILDPKERSVDYDPKERSVDYNTIIATLYYPSVSVTTSKSYVRRPQTVPRIEFFFDSTPFFHKKSEKRRRYFLVTFQISLSGPACMTVAVGGWCTNSASTL